MANSRLEKGRNDRTEKPPHARIRIPTGNKNVLLQYISAVDLQGKKRRLYSATFLDEC